MTPSFISAQYIPYISIDSINYYREHLDWANYHHQLNKLITKEDALTNAAIIIDFINDESTKLKAKKEDIESSYIWNFVAKMFAINGNYEKAVPYYGKSIDALTQLNDTTYLHLVLYYHSQVIILGINDPTNALESSTEALRLYKKRKDVSPHILGKLHYAQGWSYRGLKEFDKAIESFTKSISLNGDTDGYVETFLCRTYLENGNYKKAINSAILANEKYRKIYNEENHECLLLIGRAKSAMGLHLEAEELIIKSIRLSTKSYNKHHSEYIKLFYFLAEAQYKAGDYDKAITSIHKIIKLSNPSIKDGDLSALAISSPFSNLWVSDGLILLGQCNLLKYKHTKDKRALELALKSYDKSIEDLHLRRAELTTWQSKQEINKYSFKAYEGAIESSYLMYNLSGDESVLNQVLNYMEGSRSILLKAYQNEVKIQHAVLSKGQRVLLDSLKSEIAITEKAYYVAIDSCNIKESELLNKRLVEQRKAWKNIIKPYSEYISQKGNQEVINGFSISHIQNQLSDSTVLIMYYELSNKILCVLISQKKKIITVIDKTATFLNKLDDLYTSISDWEQIQKTFYNVAKSYKDNSAYLGDKLLPGLNTFDQHFNKLIIIPHGKLFSIPFETLIYRNHLLIEKTSIQYVLACDQINNIEKSNKRFDNFFGGFAPSYSDVDNSKNDILLRENLVNLPGTRQTLKYLSNKFKGEVWIDHKATKEAFIINASRFKLLHLGMHGQTHKEMSNLSKLYFDANESSSLTVGEIKSMNLEPELLVLSACQTNVGIIKEGEGPLSLAYAFLYAGSKSVLSSLWSVPDIQTSQIMVSFYDNLAKGYNKSKALRNAKLDYLRTAVGIERHPSYWAGFIIIGNDQPVFEINPIKYVYLGICITLLFGLFYKLKIKFYKKIN